MGLVRSDHPRLVDMGCRVHLLSDPQKVGRIRRKMQEAYDYLLRAGRARPDGISGRVSAISIGGMPDI